MTLAEYLTSERRRGVIDFRLRATVRPDGAVTFYVHPLDRDGGTRDFVTAGDRIGPDPAVTHGPTS